MATTLVCFLFFLAWCIAKLGAIVNDNIAELSEDAWHPLKRGLRVGTALMGVTMIIALAWIFWRILLTIVHGGVI